MKTKVAAVAGTVLCAMLSLSACGGGESEPKALERSQALSIVSTPLMSIPTYTVTNLDLGGGWGTATQKGINSLGQVVGESGLPGGTSSSAFFYDGSSMVDIGGLGGTRATASALNNHGLVTGNAATSGNGGWTAFAWTRTSGIRRITPGSDTYGNAVNDSGVIVGGGAGGGFFWTEVQGYQSLSNSYFTPLAVNASGQMAGNGYDPVTARSGPAVRQIDGTLMFVRPNGDYNGWATVINDNGVVGGWLFRPVESYYYRAFAAQGGVTDFFGNALATTPTDFSMVNDLNQAGQMIGTSSVTDTLTNQVVSTTGFFRSAGGVVTDLGRIPEGGVNAFTVPLAINNSGQVVGYAGSPTLGWRAFTWAAATGLVDLNTRLVNAPAGLFLYQALAISDNGSVVAFSNTGLVLLKPVSTGPAPAAPTLGPIVVASPLAVGSSMPVSLEFTDVNSEDTHTAMWQWGDGSAASIGVVSEVRGSGSTAASHVYAAAGVYNVSVSVTDSSGRTTNVGRDVVVYDPAAGFVTGSGWLNSPIGAYRADATLAGRADFAFVSKYKRGASAPSGETTFQFRAARLGFYSSTYEWMVIGGARAQFKGTGELNGKPGYKFMLTAVDGSLIAKGTADRFRIKIWHFDTEREVVVLDYDNQIDSGNEGGNAEGTTVAGGSIVVQK